MNSPHHQSVRLVGHDWRGAFVLCVAMATSGCLGLPDLPELASASDSGQTDDGVARDLGTTPDASDSNLVATFRLRDETLMAAVTGLPVYLPLPTGEVRAHEASSLVVLANGVQVPAEVDNTSEGTGLWTLVDFDRELEITVLLGEPSEEPVWSGFTAVHHFEELGPGQNFVSAVGDGEYAVSPSGAFVTERGRFGEGIIAAAVSARYEMPRIGAEPEEALTVEMWFKEESASGIRTLIDQRDGCLGWGVDLLDNNLRSEVAYEDPLGELCGDDNVGNSRAFTPIVRNEAWHQVVVVFDRTTAAETQLVFHDGEYLGKEPLSSMGAAGSAGIFLGSRTDGASVFDGVIDEVRFSPTRRSNDWIGAQYRAAIGETLTRTFPSE